MMAGTLKAHLLAIRAALKTATSVPVELRDEMTYNPTTGEYQPPATESYVILDLIGATPNVNADRSWYSDLVLQVGCYARSDIIAALALFNTTHATLTSASPSLDLDEGPVFADVDASISVRGVIGTYRMIAAFNSFV